MHIKRIRSSIILFLLAFTTLFFTLKDSSTNVLAAEDITVEIVATYNYDKVPAEACLGRNSIFSPDIKTQKFIILSEFLFFCF